MKTNVLHLLFAPVFASTLGFGGIAEAQIVVVAPPPPPAEVMPCEGAVWTPGYYVWRGHWAR